MDQAPRGWRTEPASTSSTSSASSASSAASGASAASPSWRDYQPRPAGERFPLCTRLPERPGLWDLAEHEAARRHWVGILRRNAHYLLELVRSDGLPIQRPAAERAVGLLEQMLDEVLAGPAARELRTVHDLTLVREELLRRHGLYDPYFLTKRRQAETYFEAAGRACEAAWHAAGREARGGDPAGRDVRDALVTLLSHLLAGNLFDLGSQSTQEAFRAGRLDPLADHDGFRAEVEAWIGAQPREAIEPWLPRPRPLEEPGQGRVLLLADNAGPDFMLGILPVALYLARRWTVWIVANTHPASSDITYAEAAVWIQQLAGLGAPGSESTAGFQAFRDPSSSKGAEASPLARALASGRLRLVASGTGSPGIDLAHVGSALCEVAREADWILIDGQGRGVETNWTTRFRVPAYRVAVVKDDRVAGAIGCQPGRPLLRYDPAAPAAGPTPSGGSAETD